jgi:hypothetical protein
MHEAERAVVSIGKKNCFLEVRDSNLNHVKGHTDQNTDHECYRTDLAMKQMSF